MRSGGSEGSEIFSVMGQTFSGLSFASVVGDSRRHEE